MCTISLKYNITINNSLYYNKQPKISLLYRWLLKTIHKYIYQQSQHSSKQQVEFPLSSKLFEVKKKKQLNLIYSSSQVQFPIGRVKSLKCHKSLINEIFQETINCFQEIQGKLILQQKT